MQQSAQLRNGWMHRECKTQLGPSSAEEGPIALSFQGTAWGVQLTHISSQQRLLSNFSPSPALGMPAVLLPCSQGTVCGVKNSLKASQGLFSLTTAPSVILLGAHNLPLAREDKESFFQHEPLPHQDRSPREVALGHQGCACVRPEIKT